MKNVKIVQSLSDLPNIAGARRVFCDVETTSGRGSDVGSSAYRGHKIAGTAFTFDDCPTAFYLPVRHNPTSELFAVNYHNIDADIVSRFLSDLLCKGREWVNHGIKFDYHFLKNDGVDIKVDSLVCSLTMAKLVDMQKKQDGYDLKNLGLEWCGIKPESRDEVKLELKRRDTGNYADIDIEILGEYAGCDVLTNRTLFNEIIRRKYEGIDRVWDLEIATTRMLVNVERRGVLLDMDGISKARETTEVKIAQYQNELRRLGFGGFNPSSSDSIQDYVIDVLKLPIMGYTDRGQPSMNYDALMRYKELPVVRDSERLTKFFEIMVDYRDRSQFLSLYMNGWMEHVGKDNRIHPFYNQIVRTGRMSCSDPNIQQLAGEAKNYVIPGEGCGFNRRDYSQIEYRVIAELTGDQRIIQAYQQNPKQDFHQFVADLCGIERSPAKNVNFGISFGMGEKGLLVQLARLLGSAEAGANAERILRTYHETFPRIKERSQWAKNLARKRANWQAGEYGYIQTLYGRRRGLQFWPYGTDRHIGEDETRKAFNTAVQGTAADMMKEAAVKLDNDPLLQSAGVELIAIVHDEPLMIQPEETLGDPEINQRIDDCMTKPSIKLSVPIMVGGGRSVKSWKAAAA